MNVSEKLVEAITDIVKEVVESEMPKPSIGTEDIDGFDDAVERLVDDKLNGFEVEADNVSGLGDEIDSRVEDAIRNIDPDDICGLDDMIDSSVHDAAEKIIKEKIEEIDVRKIVEDSLRSEWGHVIIVGAVREVLAKTIASLLGGSPAPAVVPAPAGSDAVAPNNS